MDFRIQFRRKRKEPHEIRNEQREERSQVKRMRGMAVGLSIPSMLVAGPVAGWLIGNWLDNRFGTGYWMIVLIITGTLAGFKAMIDMLIKLGREQ